VLAPKAGAERVHSAAQAAPASIRVFTAKTRVDSVVWNNALMVKEFKKDIDRTELTIPFRDSPRVARKPAGEGEAPTGPAQYQAPI
jgi:hypothetical protein